MKSSTTLTLSETKYKEFENSPMGLDLLHLQVASDILNFRPTTTHAQQTKAHALDPDQSSDKMWDK